MFTDLIKALDILVKVNHELLDICCEQAKIIEQHGIKSESLKESKNKMEVIKNTIGGISYENMG